MGIIRNHYVGRTFIQPTQDARELSVRMKLSPNHAVLAGKRVMLIDDSIVRGTNSVRVVRMVREAGATEVHLRSASPPLKWPDFYGIDTPERNHLLAANRSLAEMAHLLEVDSLDFLSVEGLYWAMGAGPRDRGQPAVHRPLLHRRLPNPSARPRDRPRPQRQRSSDSFRSSSMPDLVQAPPSKPAEPSPSLPLLNGRVALVTGATRAESGGPPRWPSVRPGRG